jgi:hypothetical protein
VKTGPASFGASWAAARAQAAAQDAAAAEARPEADDFVYVSVPELLIFIRRGLLPALLLALLAGAGAYLFTSNKEPQYTAVALLLSIRPAPITALPGMLPPPALDPAIYSAAVHEGPILDRLLQVVPAAAGLTREQLQQRVRVLSDAALQSSIVRVEVTDSDALVAAQLANRTATELINWDLQRSAQQITELPLNTAFVPGGQLSMLHEARVPDAPVGANSKVAAALSATLAVVFTYLLLLAAGSREQQLPTSRMHAQ